MTPAALAMSSILVDLKPRSTNSASAASRISAGRTSLRRCQRVIGQQEDLLMAVFSEYLFINLMAGL
ncbi:hypothetical protein D3C84_1112450 [compost metagenome]